MDRRKALGDGSGAPDETLDEVLFDNTPTDPFENRLPGPYPYDQHRVAKPDIDYSGEPNPAICSNRPIADMEPKLGGGDLKEGTAFRVPMGEPGYDDPDFR